MIFFFFPNIVSEKINIKAKILRIYEYCLKICFIFCQICYKILYRANYEFILLLPYKSFAHLPTSVAKDNLGISKNLLETETNGVIETSL